MGEDKLFNLKENKKHKRVGMGGDKVRGGYEGMGNRSSKRGKKLRAIERREKLPPAPIYVITFVNFFVNNFVICICGVVSPHVLLI